MTESTERGGSLHIIEPESRPEVDLEALSEEERALIEGVYEDFRRLLRGGD